MAVLSVLYQSNGYTTCNKWCASVLGMSMCVVRMNMPCTMMYKSIYATMQVYAQLEKDDMSALENILCACDMEGGKITTTTITVVLHIEESLPHCLG